MDGSLYMHSLEIIIGQLPSMTEFFQSIKNFQIAPTELPMLDMGTDSSEEEGAGVEC